jgi:hypothetical protein
MHYNIRMWELMRYKALKYVMEARRWCEAAVDGWCFRVAAIVGGKVEPSAGAS